MAALGIKFSQVTVMIKNFQKRKNNGLSHGENSRGENGFEKIKQSKERIWFPSVSIYDSMHQ